MFMYASNDFSANFRGANRRFNSQLPYLKPHSGFWQVKIAVKIAVKLRSIFIKPAAAQASGSWGARAARSTGRPTVVLTSSPAAPGVPPNSFPIKDRRHY
jgi:hypothetical protein